MANKKGMIKISIIEQMANQNLPDYYPSMYLDGFKPTEIYAAAKRSFYEDAERRKAGQEADEPFNVNITSEVKIKR